jgi:GNAT superfamily N-acetyltransferase
MQHRLATLADLPAMKAVMTAAITELLKPFLSADEIASSQMIMGLDTQLVEDGTYFLVEEQREIAGCGGWSRRATMYGGDHSPGRDGKLLDPATEPARVRAMYTSPKFARRGVGRLILSLCASRTPGGLSPGATCRHPRRPAALPRLRLSRDRALHRRPRRSAGSAAADGEGPLKTGLPLQEPAESLYSWVPEQSGYGDKRPS